MRRRDRYAEFRQFAVDAAVSHSGFSVAGRTTSRAMRGTVGGRPGLRRPLVSYLLAASLRCQASSVAGVTGKTSAQRLRGMSRASAANHTRSAGPYRIRPAFRRSTAFSCRSTSSSASIAGSLRDIRTARPSTRRTSRQTILSSTPPANHHRAQAAGEGAGQPRNRLFERHWSRASATLLMTSRLETVLDIIDDAGRGTMDL